VGGLSRSPKEVNTDVPEELDAVTARLLSNDPEDRYPDASALVEDLERAKEGLPLDAATRERRWAKKPGKGFQRRGVLVALALVLVSVGVIAAVALTRGLPTAGSGQESPSAQGPGEPALEDKKLPAKGGPLAPGTYHSDKFEPALCFSVDKDWVVYGRELSDALPMALSNTQEQERPSTFGFYSPKRVIDQSDPERDTNVPAPKSVDGWVEWFQKHPNLTTEEPVPVTVGGVSGVQIDAVVSSEPKESQFPPAFWVLSNDLVFYDFKGVRSRTILLDVGGDTVVIDTSASSSDKFEKLLPKAQMVLDTVKWKDAS
jgi:hypothetical protein